MLLVRCLKLRLLLKPFWGLSWGPVGGLLGSQEGPGRGSWRLLGPAWGHLGPSWLPLPRFGPFRAPKRAPREANLSPFGTILGPQEGLQEAIWGHFGPQRGSLGAPVGSTGIVTHKRFHMGSCNHLWARNVESLLGVYLTPSFQHSGQTLALRLWGSKGLGGMREAKTIIAEFLQIL